MLTCSAGGFYNSNYLINNVLQDEGTCINFNKKINIAVLDSCSFMPWTDDSCVYGYFNQINYTDCIGNSTCMGHPQPFTYFQFECSDSVQVTGLINMLNSIPVGYHILAFTWGPNPSGCIYPPSLRNAFSTLGSNMFLTILDTVPFIFYVKKGFISTLSEVSGTNASDTVTLTKTIECIPSAVQENKNPELTINIFPNPVSNNLSIHASFPGVKYLKVYDLLGNQILNEKFSLQKYSVDVSGMPSGIYFVEVQNENSVARAKFVKR